MVVNASLKIIVIVEIFLIIQIVAYRYVIVVKDEEIFSPCDMANTNYLDKYFDISNMNFKYLENGSVYFHGETILIRDIGAKNNPASIQLYKKNRDSWVSTVYNMNRDDVCKHLYDRTELWFSYMKKIPVEKRTCPLHEGNKFYFDVVSDMEIELADPRIAGEYKIQLLVTLTELNEVLCANILTEVYKK